jgi:hypothetical protein
MSAWKEILNFLDACEGVWSLKWGRLRLIWNRQHRICQLVWSCSQLAKRGGVRRSVDSPMRLGLAVLDCAAPNLSIGIVAEAIGQVWRHVQHGQCAWVAVVDNRFFPRS